MRVISITSPIKSTFFVGGYKFCSERGQSNAIAGVYFDGDVLHVTVNGRRVKIAEDVLWVDGDCYGSIATDDRIHVSSDGSVSINDESRPPSA